MSFKLFSIKLNDLFSNEYVIKALKISVPLVPFVGLNIELENPKTIDERINRLGEIKQDLEGAIKAVDELEKEAVKRKSEVENLQESVQKLEEDKNAAESLLKIPEDSFTRILDRATSKSRIRGIIEGLIIGFVTGTLSSFLVWYLTKQ